jgi:hypothetical protein
MTITSKTGLKNSMAIAIAAVMGLSLSGGAHAMRAENGLSFNGLSFNGREAAVHAPQIEWVVLPDGTSVTLR